ncbi:MAG: GH25 family lysozyme [Erysipelotrichaceae bacterium]
MKKIFCLMISITLLSTLFVPVSIQAEDTNDFNDVEIVTEDTYQPIDPSKISGMKDVPIGKHMDPLPPNRMSRSFVPSTSKFGTYWKVENGFKNFYDANNTLTYHQGTKFVIDVSKWQKVIDWDKVKAAGVDGAIIRIGFGFGNMDEQFKRNIEECNRLGIPYGIYLYSYAYDANFAYAEADSLIQMLTEVKANLSYPIYYDIERFDPFVYEGVTRYVPTTTAEYESIIGTFLNRMNQRGYDGRTHVYSNRYYLETLLNSPKILPYVSWIAAYTSTLSFENPYYGGEQGWQYSSVESVDGINGRVDTNCFSNQFYSTPVSTIIPDSIKAILTANNLVFDNGYISGFVLGSDIATLTSALAELGEITIFDSNGKIITSGKIATGQRISIKMKNAKDASANPDIYDIAAVVRGDVNGDGKISAVDYSYVKNQILKIDKLTGANAVAANVDKNEKISAIDYSLIKNDILNISKINQ